MPATAATLPATAAALATSAATSAITDRLGLGVAPTLPGAFAAPPPIAALAAAAAPLVSVAPQWVAALIAISETPTSIPAAVSSPVWTRPRRASRLASSAKPPITATPSHGATS